MRPVRSRSALSDPLFRQLYRRLLLSYLGVIVAIFCIVGITLYRRMAHRLYSQFDRELATASQTGIQLFPLVYHEYHEHIAPRPSTTLSASPSSAPSHNRISPLQSGSIGISDLLQVYNTEDESEDGKYEDDDEIVLVLEQPDKLSYLAVEWFDTQLHRILLEDTAQGVVGLADPPDPQRLNHAVSDVGSIRRWTSPVYDTEEQLLGYVRTSGSIVAIKSELHQLALELWFGAVLALGLAGISGQWLTRRALTPIVQSFEQLRRFTADASHELRSPLTTISTTLAMLQRSPNNTSNYQRNLNRMHQSSERMSLLVNDLLLLARVDGGLSTAVEAKRRFSLDELLDNLVDEIEPIADRQNVHLQFTLAASPRTNWDIEGRPQQLYRAFFNLIENAVQYTPKGGAVTVSLSAINGLLCVQIQDTGIGIAADDLPHIFDRFWRADQARLHRSHGNGLGLSIVATIIQAHAGRITVTSTIGQGSCFRVQLPALPTDPTS